MRVWCESLRHGGVCAFVWPVPFHRGAGPKFGLEWSPVPTIRQQQLTPPYHLTGYCTLHTSSPSPPIRHPTTTTINPCLAHVSEGVPFSRNIEIPFPFWWWKQIRDPILDAAYMISQQTVGCFQSTVWASSTTHWRCYYLMSVQYRPLSPVGRTAVTVKTHEGEGGSHYTATVQDDLNVLLGTWW